MEQARCTKRHSGIRLAALPSSERWHAETRSRVWASLSSQERAALGALRLSDRERDVVACAIVEQSQKETAETLGLSLHTIKRHGRAIAFKTRFENVGALARHIRSSARGRAARPRGARGAPGTRTLNACHTSSGGMFETRRKAEAEDGGESGEAGGAGRTMEMATPMRQGFEGRSRRARTAAAGAALALAAVVAVAFPREASAYRTGADLPEMAGTERVRWADGVIPYVLHDVPPSGLSLAQTEDVVTKSIGSWSGLACGGPSFAYQGVSALSAAPNDGINTIEVITSGWLTRGFAPDAAATTDTQYAKDAEGHWQIVEADIYLNAELFQWKLTTPDGPNVRDLSSVVTHEAGHVLGLLHPCEPSGADGAPDCASNASFAETTMYPIYAAEQASLAEDDVAGACFLYPTPPCEQTGCSAGSTCTPAGCRAICEGVTCAEGEVCTPAGCDDLLGTCEGDADCTAGLHCEAGRCLPGLLPAGDPCTAASNCASGICGPGGSCQAPCASDADCVGTQACMPLDGAGAGEVAVCDGRPLGASCEHAGQCLGGECLAGAVSSPVCTRACDAANAVHAACPSGWECRSVGPRLVCAPLSPADEGGCSTAAARSREAPDDVEWFVVLSAFLLCARASGSRARRAVSSLSNRAR